MADPTTEEFVELAIELIDDFIEKPNATWLSLSAGVVADENKPWDVTQATADSTPVKIAFLQDKLEDRQLLMYLKGRSIPVGQVNGIMYGYSFTPMLNDVVVWNDKQLTVKAIDPIQVIDEPIVYIMEFGT